MLLKVELLDGTELVAAEVRENVESSYNHAPIRSLNMHFKPAFIDANIGVDELMSLFGNPENTKELKVYRRDHALGENGEDVFGEWELHDAVSGFIILKGVFKDFYSKQLDVILTRE
ncbi:hypothetical protein [Lysinibacillus pakistanensis]|uniref:hypothetical protein n=1 Tax=Lysinibacillus pakistanensis TaxID=759811 RepID=UPI003D282AD6